MSSEAMKNVISFPSNVEFCVASEKVTNNGLFSSTRKVQLLELMNLNFFEGSNHKIVL